MMRKNITRFTIGMAASMLLLGGCASVQPEETTAVTEIQTEVQTEASATDSTEALEEDREEYEMMGEIGVDVPIRIFGEIQEITQTIITVDNQSEVSAAGEMELLIDPENTLILDASTGFPATIEEIQMGSFEAYLGPVMTMSLPPQTVPSVVVVNIPEDAAAPQYVVASGAVTASEKGSVLHSKDGSEYVIPEDARVMPFLTRNIVKLQDIQEGSRCLLWMDETGAIVKLELMADLG